MSDDLMIEPRGDDPTPLARGVLTAEEYGALARELEALKTRHRTELADRLRIARAFGTSSDNDDLLAVLEEAAVDEARIAQLQHELRSARVIDVAANHSGTAGLGAVVRVADESGREIEYELVGRRSPESGRHQVTPASPVGEALMAAIIGDEVSVELPSGRVRVLRVVDVRYPDAAEAA